MCSLMYLYRANFSVLSDSRAHFIRTACRCSRPSSPNMSCFDIFRASSSVLPFVISVSTDEQAMHMAHPLPWNRMSDMESSVMFSSMSMLSPHSGLASWWVTSGFSRRPKFTGFLE